MTLFKKISIYTYSALTLLIMGLVAKFLPGDLDFGARIKDLSHRLLYSDITFILATFVFVVGQIFRVIRNNRNSNISDSKILWNCLLILPLFFVIALLPYLETFAPELAHGTNFLSTTIAVVGVIGTLCFLFWIFFFPITIIQQIYQILTNKNKNQ